MTNGVLFSCLLACSPLTESISLIQCYGLKQHIEKGAPGRAGRLICEPIGGGHETSLFVYHPCVLLGGWVG